jgi:hypothetical protein
MSTDRAVTWAPLSAPYDRNDNGKLDRREERDLPADAFAFPAARLLPLVDAEYVEAALARFAEVAGVTDAERDAAFGNVRHAAAHFGVSVPECDWRALPRTRRVRGPSAPAAGRPGAGRAGE